MSGGAPGVLGTSGRKAGHLLHAAREQLGEVRARRESVPRQAEDAVVTWLLLLAVSCRLARRGERDAGRPFGDACREYEARVPLFVPRFRPTPEPGWSER